MRLITIIIEDDEEGSTHMRVIESGNGARETKGEIDLAIKFRAVVMEEASCYDLQDLWASGRKADDGN
jgi:hypothetical protein